MEETVQGSFQTWKTIGLGEHRTTKGYLVALEQGGGVCATIKELCEADRFRLAKIKRSVDLVRVGIRDLGLTTVATFEDVCAAAKERGLRLCPHEAAFALRLSQANTAFGGGIVVMTTPVVSRHGGCSFLLLHKKLNLLLGYPQGTINEREEMIFVAPRKKRSVH